MSELKTCTKCGNEFPATVEFFYLNGGCLAARCKACHKAAVADWQKEHSEAHKQVTKRYRLAHPEVYRDASSRYRDEHPGVDREYQKRRREEHPELCREAVKRHRALHPERHRVYERARRALKLGVPGSHTLEEFRRQYDAQDGRCFWCDVELVFGSSDCTEDHLIPVTGSGSSNGIENIVAACRSCNSRKRDMDPMAFLECVLNQL